MIWALMFSLPLSAFSMHWELLPSLEAAFIQAMVTNLQKKQGEVADIGHLALWEAEAGGPRLSSAWAT